MVAIGITVAILGVFVSVVGNSFFRRQYLRRTGQSPLLFDMSQRFGWVRKLSPSDTRKFWFVQATSAVLLALGSAIAMGALT